MKLFIRLHQSCQIIIYFFERKIATDLGYQRTATLSAPRQVTHSTPFAIWFQFQQPFFIFELLQKAKSFYKENFSLL